MNPTVGRIVLYRTRDGQRDYAAIITGLAGDGFNVFLTLFPPPGEKWDVIDSRVGVPYQFEKGVICPGTWRWPERVQAVSSLVGGAA